VISLVGNSFLATKTESKKQSEEPESTRPSKANGMRKDQRVVCNDLGLAVIAAPRSRVGSPVGFKQSVPEGEERLLSLFLVGLTQREYFRGMWHVSPLM